MQRGNAYAQLMSMCRMSRLSHVWPTCRLSVSQVCLPQLVVVVFTVALKIKQTVSLVL